LFLLNNITIFAAKKIVHEQDYQTNPQNSNRPSNNDYHTVSCCRYNSQQQVCPEKIAEQGR
jgi:hypothetical protein